MPILIRDDSSPLQDTAIDESSPGYHDAPSFIEMALAARCIVTRPGEGVKGDRCGEQEKLHCQCCGNDFEIVHDCMLRVCPDCYMKWASAKAKIVSRKAWKVINHNTWIVHAVISFKGDPNDVFKNRARAYKIARRHRIKGGLCVGHFGRYRGPDGYLHYHIIGSVDGYYEPGGGRNQHYIFKVIRSIRSSRDLRRLLRYMLGHCSIKYRTHALTFFGEWTRGLKIDKEPSQKKVCPKCRSKKLIPYNSYIFFENNKSRFGRDILMYAYSQFYGIEDGDPG